MQQVPTHNDGRSTWCTWWLLHSWSQAPELCVAGHGNVPVPQRGLCCHLMRRCHSNKAACIGHQAESLGCKHGAGRTFLWVHAALEDYISQMGCPTAERWDSCKTHQAQANFPKVRPAIREGAALQQQLNIRTAGTAGQRDHLLAGAPPLELRRFLSWVCSPMQSLVRGSRRPSRQTLR